MTTAVSELERRFFQLMVFDRAEHLSSHSTIRAYARQHKAYTLKHIAKSLAAAGCHIEAAYYAREALRMASTVKWGGYTGWRTVRALSGRWL